MTKKEITAMAKKAAEEAAKTTNDATIKINSAVAEAVNTANAANIAADAAINAANNAKGKKAEAAKAAAEKAVAVAAEAAAAVDEAKATAKAAEAPKKTAAEINFEVATALLADDSKKSTATAAEILWAEYVVATYGVKSAKTKEATANKLNEAAKTAAVKSMTCKGLPNWRALAAANGVQYPQINLNNNKITNRTIKTADFMAVHKASDGKVSLENQPDLLYQLINVFGANAIDGYHVSKETGISLKRFWEFCPDEEIKEKLKFFFDDEATGRKANSANSLQEQMRLIVDTMFGENFARMDKKHVTHLQEGFSKATKTGYNSGNELRLLDLVVLEVYNNVNHLDDYKHKSGLSIHKDSKKNK